MANVNDMFNEVTKEQSFYQKGAKKTFTPFTKGEYFGHITEVDSKILDVKGGQYKARLYTFTVTVDDENAKKTFHYEGIDGKMVETDGKPYVGKTFKGKLWRFLEPAKDDTFESNTSGNKGYLKFCETIGVECPTETRTINGEDVEVQILPTLSPENMLGQPVIAFVDKGREFTNKRGERTFFWDCKFCKKWEGGVKKEISNDGSGLPF
jgi:hypothetical protein|tara:strand:+ start:515 stop:1141 length:627 start_codon:yes stop_codon:yes gene_type:complete